MMILALRLYMGWVKETCPLCFFSPRKVIALTSYPWPLTCRKKWSFQAKELVTYVKYLNFQANAANTTLACSAIATYCKVKQIGESCCCRSQILPKFFGVSPRYFLFQDYVEITVSIFLVVGKQLLDRSLIKLLKTKLTILFFHILLLARSYWSSICLWKVNFQLDLELRNFLPHGLALVLADLRLEGNSSGLYKRWLLLIISYIHSPQRIKEVIFFSCVD